MSANFFKRITRRVFVICNLGVAILFLLGCYASWFDPKSFWFLGLFTLASFYLLLLLVAFIFLWLFAKPAFALISVAAIVLAWSPLKQLVQIKLTPNFTIKKHPANLRVMSWNVEHFDILEHKTHPERRIEMIGMINEYQPDIACFQEMVGSDSVPSAINYIPDFMSRMQMADYHYVYNWKLDFDGNHHFGIIIFSKYPFISKHMVSFPPNDYNSIFQYADIVKDADTFRIFNLHLQSLKFSDNNLKYMDDPSINDKSDLQNSKNIISKLKRGFLKRQVQSDRIRLEIDRSPYPVIVCGDFNDVPNSYAYDKIGDGLKNSFAEKGTGIGRTFFGISPTLRIDNIFADERFNVEQYVRVKKKISDHFPIIADLYFKKH